MHQSNECYVTKYKVREQSMDNLVNDNTTQFVIYEKSEVIFARKKNRILRGMGYSISDSVSAKYWREVYITIILIDYDIRNTFKISEKS